MMLAVEAKQRLRIPHSAPSLASNGFTYVRNVSLGRKLNQVTLRAVQHGARLQAASELLNDRYAWRGYGATHSIPSGVHHTTFTAEVDGDVVGTITLATDSDRGLAIDQTFADEMQEIRSTNSSHICELIRLAFHAEVRSHELLANLFHFTFIVGTTISNCTDLLIEVSPRHTTFYAAMLGFERMGPLRTNQSVGSASQLMRLKVKSIRDNIDATTTRERINAPRSMYTKFFSPAEEAVVRYALISSQQILDVSRDLQQEPPKYADITTNSFCCASYLSNSVPPNLGNHAAKSALEVDRAA